MGRPFRPHFDGHNTPDSGSSQPWGDPGFVLKLTYNSAIYDVNPGNQNQDNSGNHVPTNNLGPTFGAGWIYNTQYSIELTTRPNPNPANTWPCPASNLQLQYFYRMTLVLPDGSRHLLRLAGQDVYQQTEDGYYQYQPNGVAAVHCGNPTAQSSPLTGVLTYYTADATFLNVSINTATCANYQASGVCPWTLYYPDGSNLTQQTLGAGNFTLLSRTGNATTVAQAHAGSIWTTTISDSANPPRSITLQTTGGVTDTITILGVYGHPVQTSVTWRTASMPARTYMCAPNGYPNSPGTVGGEDCALETLGFPVVGSIILPAQLCDSGSPNCGLGYQFTYDIDNEGGGIGELSSVTTPLASTTAYHYLMDANGTNIAGWTAYTRNSLSTRTVSPASNDPYAFPAETTSYVITNAIQSTITAPDGGVTTYYFYSNAAAYPPPQVSADAGLIYKIVYPDGTIDERYWNVNNPPNFPTGSYTAALVFNNPYIQTEYRTIDGEVAIKNYTYDNNGNVTQLSEYDWSNAGNIPRTQDQYQSPVGVPSGLTPVRTTVSQYYYPAATYTYSEPAGSSPIWRSAQSSEAVQVGPNRRAVQSDAILVCRCQFEHTDELDEVQPERVGLGEGAESNTSIDAFRGFGHQLHPVRSIRQFDISDGTWQIGHRPHHRPVRLRCDRHIPEAGNTCIWH